MFKLTNTFKAFEDFGFHVVLLICVFIFFCSRCFRIPTESHNYW